MLSSQRFCTQCGAANRQQAAFCFACGQSLDEFDATNASTDLSPSVSRLLKDRYRILSRLGSGGMGAVDKAEDTLFNQRLVAIKEMSQQGLNAQQRQQAAADFKREAYMLANLQHPGLPAIYDYFSDEGQWYLVMDFIAGETLEDHLNNNGGWLPIRETLAIAIQLCNVLDYLHTRQPPIIFRDLKPANVMLTPTKQVVLVDFGIARHFKPGQLKDTVSFGSAGYAAPEQYGKAQTTPRSDIYSLGAILHQCLSGNDPSANSPTPFDFPPVYLHGQFAPPSLHDMIRQMVEMNPNIRPENMQVVLQQLTYTEQQLDRLQAQAQIQPATTPIPPAPKAVATLSSILSKPTAQKPIPERSSTAEVATAPQTRVQKPTTSTVNEYHTNFGIIHTMALTLSPDGSVLALGDDHGNIAIWDINKAGLIAISHTHSYAITALAWSPKRELIASIEANNLLIVSRIVSKARIGEHHFRYRTQVSMLLSMVWSPDGEYLSLSDSRGIISIHKVTNGQRVSQYSGHTSPVKALHWSSNGKLIASGDQEGQIQVWRADNLKQQATFTGRGPINTIAFSPDSKELIATDKMGQALIWSLATQETLIKYTGHSPQQITTCAWSPNGRYIATGSSDTTIQIWRANTGIHVVTHDRHKAAILDLAWLPDSESVISMDVDNNLHIWKLP